MFKNKHNTQANDIVNNNKNTFKINWFLIKTFICSALHTSLISCVMIPYVRHLGMLPVQISIIITSKRIVRIFGDAFFGLFFDRFGAKTLFIVGRIMKLCCYLLLLQHTSFWWLCFTMVVYGLSEGTVQGKVSSFIYNNLKANDSIKKFPKAMSLYYLFIDGHLAMMKFLTGILLGKYGYNVVIYISIIMNITSIILIIMLIPDNKENNLQQFISHSFKDVINKLIFILKQDKIILHIMIVYGILVFFVWQFGSIASMVLLDMGMSDVNITFIGGIMNLCMIAGTIISLIFFQQSVSLKKVCVSLCCVVFFGTITTLSYNMYLFCVFMAIIDLCYVVCEVALEKNLEFFSDKHIRGTAISLALITSNLVSSMANLLIGFIAQIASYKLALNIIMLMVFFILIFFARKIIIKK